MSAEQVCGGCGLCCDGSLFTRVPLGIEERPPSTLRVIARPDGWRAVAQPCTARVGDSCVVYAARPEGCRRFSCLLLGALADGEVTLDEALEVVATARARIADVAAELPDARGAPPASAMQRARQRPPTEALQRAQHWLDRYFGR